MKPDQNTAGVVLQAARNAFQSGNNQDARRYAQQAAEINPGLEEPWLILAALADPKASGAGYLEMALKANPLNEKTHRELFEAWKQAPGHDKTARVTIQPTHNLKGQSHISQPAHRFVFISTALLMSGAAIMIAVVFLAAAAAWFGLPEIAKDTAAVAALAMGRGGMPPLEQKPGMYISAASAPLLVELPVRTETAVPRLKIKATPIPARAANPTPNANPTGHPLTVVSGGEKRIVVSISEQHLYAYEGNSMVYSFIVSTGKGGGTLTGTFPILDKIRKPYSDLWGFWMPYWMGIYWGGDLENGLHALPVTQEGETLWGDQLGSPVTYGCVVLSSKDARRLYNWADLNTVVEIRK